MTEDKYTLDRTIEERLFELSHQREDNFVTPVILEYLVLRYNMGLNNQHAIGLLEARYLNIRKPIAQADRNL